MSDFMREPRTVHVLHEGATLCGIATPPYTWPIDEFWTTFHGRLTGPNERWCAKCIAVKRGLPSGKAELEKAAPLETLEETVERLLKEIEALHHKLNWAKVQYDKLNEIYNKLADTWNAFQATTRTERRDVQRAEAAGEVTRKLAEVLMALAYGKEISPAELKLLSRTLWKASGEGP